MATTKVSQTIQSSREKPGSESDKLYKQCKQHYSRGYDETDRRRTGKNLIGSLSFDEADELFRSWLNEDKWPYDALIFDPRVFTFIFEKTSRLISNKPKGKLVPREGGDVLRAKINNALLSFQWDQANYGGTMISKWALMDINTRKYGASFALCKWRYECDKREVEKDGKKKKETKVLFDGPEMTVLNNRDCAHDQSATSIESANWFQVRDYVTWQSLKTVNDQREKPVYKNLNELMDSISLDAETSGGEGRSPNWISRNREISGLEQDPYGNDSAYKTIEIVTEYRKDKWITFAPRHGLIIREIENPYKNNQIPIVMLKYYAIDDDLYGLSEIEPVKGIQKAINALLCQYLDEINQALYTPIAVGPGVKEHTLQWGKGARWIMNNPMTDFRLVTNNSNAASFFQSTYSALVASMMTALGESSLGVSNQQPFQTDKTATEVKALQLQRNARDNYNQIYLAEAMKRQYKLWFSMNQTLLFSDPKKKSYIFRIVGSDALKYFQKRDLNKEELSKEGLKGLFDNSVKMQKLLDSLEGDNVIKKLLASNPGLLDALSPDMAKYRNAKYPVKVGEETVTKLRMDDDGESGLLAVEPSDLVGNYDFIIDVESMTVGADEERKQSRQQAVTLLTSNPNVSALLQTEGIKPKFKDLFVVWLEDMGMSDAERFFETIQAGDVKEAVGEAVPAEGGDAKQIALQKAIEEMEGKRGPRANAETPKVQGITPPGDVQLHQQPGGANYEGVPSGQMPQGFQEEVTEAEGTNLQTISPESLIKTLNR